MPTTYPLFRPSLPLVALSALLGLAVGCQGPSTPSTIDEDSSSGGDSTTSIGQTSGPPPAETDDPPADDDSTTGAPDPGTTGNPDPDTTGDPDPGTTGGPDPMPDFPNPDTVYRLKTPFHGGAGCLESNQADWEWQGGNSHMVECNYYSGQMWSFTPEQYDGQWVYRLRSLFQGDAHCLDGNDPDSMVHDGAAFMEVCGNSLSQLWRIVPDGDYVRLHNLAFGDERCLESNQVGSALHGGNTFMSPCAGVSGQSWHIGHLDHYALDLCDPMGLPLGIAELPGSFCSYECDVDEDCPIGPEGTSHECALSDGVGNYCGLFCDPADDTCPGSSTCQPFPGDRDNGACTY